MQKLLLAFAILFFFGCGGDDPPPKAGNSVGRAIRPVPVAPPVPAPPRAANRKPRQKNADSEEDDELDPSVDPSDVFAVGENVPTFEILGQAPEVEPTDVFYARAPVGKNNADTFLTDSISQTTETGTPNPDFELPRDFQGMADFGYSEDGYPWRIRSDRDGSVMTLIPHGVFIMGKNGDAPEVSPELSVYLQDYYIDVTEVTVAQFEKFRAARKAKFLTVPPEPPNASDPGEFPVLGLKYNQARLFALWAGKRLPTEPEWEKASRGSEGRAHPWGNRRAIWHRNRDPEQIDVVGSFPLDVSEFGVLDMAGNAREWCKDAYSKRTFQMAADANEFPLRKWRGPPKTAAVPGHRVVKGNGPGWVLWHRSGMKESEGSRNVGFRCVIRVSSPKLSGK